MKILCSFRKASKFVENQTYCEINVSWNIEPSVPSPTFLTLRGNKMADVLDAKIDGARLGAANSISRVFNFARRCTLEPIRIHQPGLYWKILFLGVSFKIFTIITIFENINLDRIIFFLPKRSKCCSSERQRGRRLVRIFLRYRTWRICNKKNQTS